MRPHHEACHVVSVSQQQNMYSNHSMLSTWVNFQYTGKRCHSWL